MDPDPRPPPRRRYQLLLEALPHPDGVPDVIRLRCALKVLRRAFFLKCVSALEVPADDPHAPDPPARPA